jgi:uncharacterized protein involved in exopolysaccharide biosynthesis
VELNDALRRVFGQHRGLIVWSVVLGLLLAALIHLGDTRTYTASTRFALDTADPETQAESASIADTAKAIATSPVQIKGAIDRARMRTREPVDLTEEQISIRALGSSGVLQLSVTDSHARAAAALANALAERVINARLRVSSGQLKEVLNDLNGRIGAVNRRLAGIDSQVDAISGDGGLTASSGDPESVQRLRELLRKRDRLTQQRTVLESERVRALSTDAMRPAPSIISAATPPAKPDPSKRIPDIVLGGLLGLIVGAGLAALCEALRPTLVGGEALARELDTPLIGTLTESSKPGYIDDMAAVTGRLQLAARARGVASIGLVTTRRELDLEELAERINAIWVGSAAPVQPFNAQQLALSNGGGTGLALVAPPTLKMTELEDVTHLLRMSPAPLVGVIACAEEHPAADR